VVNRDVGAGEVVYGVPAKPQKKRPVKKAKKRKGS
jgi:acetyltransferase-like isoleucine patch superfamily enzyme